MESQTLSEEELDHLLSRISRTQPVDPAVADDQDVRVALKDVRRSIESGLPASSVSSRYRVAVPVAYTKGTEFKPGPRADLDQVVHVNGW